MVLAWFSFIIFSMSALLISAEAGIAVRVPRAAANAPATSVGSMRLDMSVPPTAIDHAGIRIHPPGGRSWRACREVRCQAPKGYVLLAANRTSRSEERRDGQECVRTGRSWW